MRIILITLGTASLAGLTFFCIPRATRAQQLPPVPSRWHCTAFKVPLSLNPRVDIMGQQGHQEMEKYGDKLLISTVELPKDYYPVGAAEQDGRAVVIACK